MNYTLMQRNVDFMAAVRHTAVGWGNAAEFSLENVIRRVLDGGAPEFYVTYETAYRYVGLALRDALPLKINGLRRKQWNDIASRVRAVMERRSDFSMGRALVEVIDAGNAPSFYMSYATALSLYYRLVGNKERLRAGSLVRNRDFLNY